MNSFLSFLAVPAAALAALVQGGLWYSPVLFGNTYATLLAATGRAGNTLPMPMVMAGEVARCIVLAICLAVLIGWLRLGSLPGVLQLALLLWIGFQAVTLAGSVVHEGYDWRLYALHAGDALVKTCLIALVIYLWPWPKVGG